MEVNGQTFLDYIYIYHIFAFKVWFATQGEFSLRPKPR